MPTKEWLEKYQAVKEKLLCKIDLDSYFTEAKIGKMEVDTLEIGTVHFPSGVLVACDPLTELEYAQPYLQKVPAGRYPVQICVVPSQEYGDRYACVKAAISPNKPVRYELGMVGDEKLDAEIKEGAFFGFGVDAGMGCLADAEAQAAFKAYWAQRESSESGIDPYNDLFCDLLDDNCTANPKYQRDGGDWLNWTIPGTDYNIPIFAAGWGDGAYPCYFGYDAENNVCGVYIHFIDIQESYND